MEHTVEIDVLSDYRSKNTVTKTTSVSRARAEDVNAWGNVRKVDDHTRYKI